MYILVETRKIKLPKYLRDRRTTGGEEETYDVTILVLHQTRLVAGTTMLAAGTTLADSQTLYSHRDDFDLQNALDSSTSVPTSTASIEDAADEGVAFEISKSRKISKALEGLDLDFSTLRSLNMSNNVAPGTFGHALHFCKIHRLWLENERTIRDGRIVFASRKGNANVKFVIKQQTIGNPQVNYKLTPTQSCAELTALLQLGFLMTVKHIGPFFCELIEHEAFFDLEKHSHFLSTTMPRYECDILSWMDVKCPQRPTFSSSADPLASWIYTQGAGLVLATSKHDADVRLFNFILRGILLQICIGLAQAQRYCAFTHNDLHAGNVLFDVSKLKQTHLLVTGVGNWIIPQCVPSIRIIDFQMSSFDRYNSKNEFVGRSSGLKQSVHNGMSMTYDFWRFCSSTALAGLRMASTNPFAPWKRLDADIQEFLWKVCRFEGAVNSHVPSIHEETHWNPFFVNGFLCEDFLLDPVFDEYRCKLTTPAHCVTFETPNDILPFDDSRFIRRTMLGRTAPFPTPGAPSSNAPGAPSSIAPGAPSSIAPGAPSSIPPVPAPPQRLQHAFTTEQTIELETLAKTFINNYTHTALGLATLKHQHSFAQKASFLWMELLILQSACYFFWSEIAETTIVTICAMTTNVERCVYVCAVLDALVVILKTDLLWLARPPGEDHVLYFEQVKSMLNRADIQAVARFGVGAAVALPAHSLSEQNLLTPTRESDNNRFTELFKNSIKLELYVT